MEQRSSSFQKGNQDAGSSSSYNLPLTEETHWMGQEIRAGDKTCVDACQKFTRDKTEILAVKGGSFSMGGSETWGESSKIAYDPVYSTGEGERVNKVGSFCKRVARGGGGPGWGEKKKRRAACA